MGRTFEDVFDSHVVEQLIACQDESNPTFFADLITVYMSQAEELLTTMQHQLQEKHLVELADTAHKLGGSASGIGAFRMRESCKELQRAGLAEDYDRCAIAFHNVLDEHNFTKGILDEKLPSLAYTP
eukprot:Colp12_sorted_trinity150504_noHs@6178